MVSDKYFLNKPLKFSCLKNNDNIAIISGIYKLKKGDFDSETTFP
ncbi:hypothetical protein L950_0217895 [Sphingobacterium sp. IITKGP-BTPF85]|nr:hypothetical protein L950_0217895 [Sphingobacterium sp. IITKGP-BTPF85]